MGGIDHSSKGKFETPNRQGNRARKGYGLKNLKQGSNFQQFGVPMTCPAGWFA